VTASAAAVDAVRAKQAITDESDASALKWTVPGWIEERIVEEASTRLRS